MAAARAVAKALAAEIGVVAVAATKAEIDEARRVLADFRVRARGLFDARGDALFELCDALSCAPGPVRSMVELCLEPEFRRGHGASYDAVACGSVDVVGLRKVVAGLPAPRGADGRITLAVDVSNWLRPDAPTSEGRLFCHASGRGGAGDQIVPGWQYSFVVALEPGRSSWCPVLDVRRLGRADDVTGATAVQVEAVVEALAKTGQWKHGDPDVSVVFDAGYDVTRLAYLLAGLPVTVLGRMRSDRVLCFPAGPRTPGGAGPTAVHGPEFKFAQEWTWPVADVMTGTGTDRYGMVIAEAWERLHPRLVKRGAWTGVVGDLPVVEGTVVRMEVDRLPGDHAPVPVWLWWSGSGADAAVVDWLWQSYPRRFDIEHMFRMWKRTLGWTAPQIRSPERADRWTALIVIVHTQPWLARPLVEDARRPWERPARTGRMSPARVRRQFRYLHPTLPNPAGAPRPSTAGPGRPKGSKNKQKAKVHIVGKAARPNTGKKTKK